MRQSSTNPISLWILATPFAPGAWRKSSVCRNQPIPLPDKHLHFRRNQVLAKPRSDKPGSVNLSILLVPGDGPAQTFFQQNLRFIAKRLACEADVGLRMQNVAGPGLPVDGFYVCSNDAVQVCKNPIQRVSLPGCYVEYLANCLGSSAGQQAGLNRVVHIGEITGLLSVPEDRRRPPFEQRSDEYR